MHEQGPMKAKLGIAFLALFKMGLAVGVRDHLATEQFPLVGKREMAMHFVG